MVILTQLKSDEQRKKLREDLTSSHLRRNNQFNLWFRIEYGTTFNVNTVQNEMKWRSN